MWLARAELTSLRESFEVDARIMHCPLSQCASQHDAVLATLGLLQSQSSETDKARLEALQKSSLYQKAQVRISDLYDAAGHPTGTRVEIRLPLSDGDG